MINNSKKTSIKSLNKNNMPLFDNIKENQIEEPKTQGNHMSLANKNSSPYSEIKEPHSASIKSNISTSAPKSEQKTQKPHQQFSQRQAASNDINNRVNLPHTQPKPQSQTINSGNLSLGMYLQEARVKAGYSMNQVAMITKLNIHYIEALERDDFKNTPPLIYIKAYIKKLATLYKIDVEKTLNLLKPADNNNKQIPSKLIQELQETKQVNQKDEAKLKLVFQISTVVLLIIILICLIVGLIFWFSSGSSSEPSPRSMNISSVSKSEKVAEIKQITAADKTSISKEMEKLIVPQSVKLTELPISQNNQ